MSTDPSTAIADAQAALQSARDRLDRIDDLPLGQLDRELDAITTDISRAQTALSRLERRAA